MPIYMNAQDYRRRADSIERFARQAHLPQTRTALEAIAASWRAMAERVESLGGRGGVPESRGRDINAAAN